jgi:Tol biopolymer transport system component
MSRVYISSLDGQDRRELGLLPSDGSDMLLRWLPDGKQISFLWGGALWKTAVH